MLRSTLICLATALAALATTVAPATAAAGQQRQGTIVHWTVDGVQREALVFAPRATQGWPASAGRRVPRPRRPHARHLGADAHPDALAAGDRRLPAGPEHADTARSGGDEVRLAREGR